MLSTPWSPLEFNHAVRHRLDLAQHHFRAIPALLVHIFPPRISNNGIQLVVRRRTARRELRAAHASPPPCRSLRILWTQLTSGRLLGYLARLPGNRASTARCPRGRAGTPRRASGGRPTVTPPERWDMTDNELSATDAAVRERITELSVHIPCGGIRGPVSPSSVAAWKVWQSCRDEDVPVRWDGYDVSRAHDLCIICLRATAGGSSRWSWTACADCRTINAGLPRLWGLRPFGLGRHSLMNGIGVRGGAAPEVQAEQLARLQQFAYGDARLREWRGAEYRRLSAAFDPLVDIPLRVWQARHPPGIAASQDAFDRLIGPEDPLRDMR